MSDLYNFWRSALDGVMLPVVETAPQAGFYRLRRGRDWRAVAIWRDGGELVCVVGGEVADAEAVWLQCAKHAISEETYRTVCDTGRWPGDEEPAPNGHGGMGDNKPPADPDSDLAAAIEEKASAALGWLHDRTIVSQSEADRCEAMASVLLALKKRAEEAHCEAKRPHLEAGRLVDAAWKPLIDRASDAARRVKAAVTSYLLARAAEKKAAAQAAIARGQEPARIDTRGATSGLSGRKLALTTKTTAVITDWKAAVLFFADNPDVRDIVQKRANKLACDGAALPWFEIKREQVAR